MRRMQHHKLEGIKLFAEKKLLLIELLLFFQAADGMLIISGFKEQTNKVRLLTFMIRICWTILVFVFTLMHPIRIEVVRSTTSKKLDGDGEVKKNKVEDFFVDVYYSLLLIVDLVFYLVC